PWAWLARSTASHRWTMRSRIVSAAATNQSRSVATDASLPRSSASLASTALLISSISSSLAGAPAACVDRSAPQVWFALDGADLRANLGSSMPMHPMPRSVPGRLGGETGSPVGSRQHLLERFHCTGYTNGLQGVLPSPTKPGLPEFG